MTPIDVRRVRRERQFVHKEIYEPLFEKSESSALVRFTGMLLELPAAHDYNTATLQLFRGRGQRRAADG